uniref:Peptidase S8/S53 domain-containing protein n=1 Tax=Zea mays TaxID=4577 RepID=C0PAB2_MAIZE|nr:unknown [Zea mays]|eukprot:NP_001168937.1 uncharacterized LOC100382750 [Zea mays]
MKASGALGDGGTPPPSQADLSSPRDYVGHGSHTLSTAGGSLVPGASVLGHHGRGVAAGGSPGARVAAYKACYGPGCSGVDILAAIVAAVADGVHVLSLSLGAPPADYLTDLTALGAFFAVQSGVTVVCAAGNSGPQPSTATNLAPWILTVGASTMDRDFPANVSFNGDTIQVAVLAQLSGPCQGEGQDRRLRQRGERQSGEGVRGQTGGRRRHGPLQRRQHRGHRGRRRARPRGGSLLLFAVRPALQLPPVYQRSVGLHQCDRRELWRETCAEDCSVLVPGTKRHYSSDPQARHHRTGSQRDRRVQRRGLANGAPVR